ncbi:mandelate racemase/muconate lactonizing enzyme family protein [Mesorhizobium delmotii]|uniref:Putative Chloromuconate cycloisomerase n=1 Tax=Mesorhizobium delmotii TaxID=1631247 RepID=A0A2P9AM94_9HYPH|nr:enolase C-terminal domain-like protein [Mesorhizobium delmotii]SJM32261.1 putative Chloromuconate cycloisomerase [Mesorhizobium delmotii]
MVSLIRDVLAPTLIGLSAFDVERAGHALDKALPHHSPSKASLINAMYDLQGKLLGQPANTFLGGCFHNQIPVAVGIDDENDVINRVKSLWDQGIRTIKFKVGGEVDRDIRLIKRLRDSFPDTLEIRPDANAGFTFSEAFRFLKAVGDCRLQYFEQPLPPGDLRGLARLRELGTPIAVDESLFGLNYALGLARADAADVFIIKLIKLGGLHQASKVVAIAEAAGIACVVVSPYETSLGVAANLHLAASSRAFPYAAELGTGVSTAHLPGIDSLESIHGFHRRPEGRWTGCERSSVRFYRRRRDLLNSHGPGVSRIAGSSLRPLISQPRRSFQSLKNGNHG